MTRHKNDGLRKLCECPRRTWAKCSHPWHFAFKWNGEHFRFSLERQFTRIVRNGKGKWARDRATLGDRITHKTDAEALRDTLRDGIRDGSLLATAEPKPQTETLTLGQLLDTYKKQYVALHRAKTEKNVGYMINRITATELERADGERRAFGQWLVADITTDAIEQYQRVRLATTGVTGTNRHLEVLRHLFRWATSKKRKLAPDDPFRDGDRVEVKLLDEHPRDRRLRGDEGDRLLKVCPTHLYAVVQAALESGMRRGEILGLQWWQVRSEPRHEIFLPSAKTKAKKDRTIPVSSTLKAVLEMRRTAIEEALRDDDGTLDEAAVGRAHVFGNEIGEQVKDIKRAWQTAVLKAHGHTPQWVKRTVGERTFRVPQLTVESQAAYRAINLHFHDLRREAGSRWLDAGVPLHRIQKWLGHSNISQTSTYLDADSIHDDDAMRRFEETRLQQIAKESGKGHQNTASLATMTDDKAPLSSTKHH